MADERDWAPPAGDAGPEPPRYGERVQGWVAPAGPTAERGAAAPHPADAPRPPAATATGYVPPSRRGLVPLHPLSFGQLLGAAFAAIRWNPRGTVVPALVVTVLTTAITAVIGFTVVLGTVDRLQRAATADDRTTLIAGAVGTGIGATLLVLAVSVFGNALLQGVLVTVVARAVVGERPGPIAALRAAGRRILPLSAIAAMLTVLQVVAIGVLVLLVVGLVTLGTVGIVLAVLVGLVGGIGFLVGYGFLAVKLTTVPSTIVLEGLGVLPSIARSWVLMRQAFWRTFLLLAIVVAVVGVASQVVSGALQLIGTAVGALLVPNAGASGGQDQVTVLLLSTVPALIATTVVGSIGQVAQTAAVVLVYLDRRMRREGLDFDLQRFTEEGGPDPFARAPEGRAG